MEEFYTDIRDATEFDERLEALAGLIASVIRPGDYCAHGRLFAPMPRVEAGAAGVLSFPIPAVQVQALIAGAERAPYGRGEETVVDRSVRDCLQIEPDEIGVGGRTWAETFGDVLGRASEGLGCPADAVTTGLYKLLVYETGGFFAPHRDTEKADGMVATLVISLPVAGSGGELVIRHQGRETVVDMRTEEPSELVFAAFYADCEHEILPVTDGHRVCLVYNLMLRADGGIATEAPDYGAATEAIATELAVRCRDPGASGKLVWLLEHDYSAAGLSFGTLKNVDAAIGRVLSSAAERADCLVHAAIVHIEETGSASYFGYEREVEDIADDEYELIEIHDIDCWLDGWARPDGEAGEYGALPLLAGELMPPGRLAPGVPDTQRLTEASGNAGATIERLYCRAALVVWPKADSARVLAQAGAGSLAAFLAGEWRRASADVPTSGPIRDLASQAVDFWPLPSRHPARSKREAWEGHTSETLELLCSIGNREATLRFLREVVVPHYGGGLNGAIVTAAAEIGAEKMRELLCPLVASNLSRHAKGIVDLGDRLCARLEDGGDEAWRDALREMVVAMCTAMPTVGGPLDGNDRKGARVRPTPLVPVALTAVTLERFFALLWRFGLDSEAEAAARLFIGRPDLASPDRIVPALLDALHSATGARGGSAFAALWHHGSGFLLSRSRLPPAPPADWVVEADGLSCACEHCAELRRFCAAPNAEVGRFAVRQDLREHLRHEIKSGGIDIRCETERRGRPYTLVCVKTRRAFERRLRQYEEDIVWMRRLVGAAEAVPGSADIAEALRAAIGQSGLR